MFEWILNYKAQSVVHKYKQEVVIDYIKTFVAIVKHMSYKCIFTVRVNYAYQICQIEVVKAFLYDFLEKVIYIEQSHIFATELDKICKLVKALYRLKQILQI